MNFKCAGRDQFQPRSGGGQAGAGVHAEHSTDPIPLRRPQTSVGTIMIRFVGLLLAATVVLVLIWNR
ncbi:hypothetical protein [Bradyrhizobium ivorense]|uniref:hypothetical protein n=1 Tax=Bradyrhizobium ivorense TaxID=2511166 RepID=UPI00111CA60C|nr:hypothetical protein [Bradyrhizobium ivorense]